MEKSLADRTKHLRKKGFGLTQKDIRTVAFKLAVENSIQHPWNDIVGQIGVQY